MSQDYEVLYNFPSLMEQDEDEYIFDREDFEAELTTLFSYPVQLTAENSNWQGQTGYATADSADELISKCFSFGNDQLSLRKNDEGYYFRTASHDRPTGFNIYICDS